MPDDFLSEISTAAEKSDLQDSIRQFVSRCLEEIKGVELPKEPHRILILTENGLDARIDERDSDKALILGIGQGIEEWKESNVLMESIEEETGIEVTKRYLQSIFAEIAKKRDSIDEVDASLTRDIERRIILESRGTAKVEVKSLLSAVEVSEPLKIDEELWILPPKSTGELSVSPYTGYESLHPEFGHFVQSVCKFRIHQNPELDAMNASAMGYEEILAVALRLYGPSNAEFIGNFTKFSGFSGSGSMHSKSRQRRDNHPKIHLSVIDARKLKRLIPLLEDLYDYENREFRHQISVALEHYNTSLSNRTQPSASIAFSVIGLESLFKHYSVGSSTSSNQVSLYAALLLGLATDRFDSVSVKSEIDEAYGARSDYVHGGQGSPENGKTKQERMWDYLRSSIVIFTFLKNTGRLPSEGLNLENALIDPSCRKRLETKLSQFKLGHHIRIK